MDILQFSQVQKSFGSRQVLKDITFSVPEHSIFGFIGPNGAGKTTSMKILLGLLKPDAGEITVCGKKVTFGQNETNQYIGYLPDVPEFYDFMTPREYLMFCGEITGMPVKEAKERAEELLTMVGLDQEKRRIKGFSRGMKQRLGIAQALFNRPRLLICDEPTSALDPIGRKEILDILVQAKKETTVIFSTHILSDVERICDKIAFLHQGEIVLQGDLAEILSAKTSGNVEIEFQKKEETKRFTEAFPGCKENTAFKVYYERKSEEERVAMLEFMAKEKICPVRFEQLEPDLEDVFMEVAGK